MKTLFVSENKFNKDPLGRCIYFRSWISFSFVSKLV